MNDNVKQKKVQALEDGLIARIKRGDPIDEIREWFLTEITKHKGLMFSDLTPFAQAFMNQIAYAYEAWQREQEDLARNRKLN
jgi:hypothetical protein